VSRQAPRRQAWRTRLAETPPGYPHSRGRTLAVYAGLMTVILIASLDQTIVATALPHIVADLGGLASYSWVFSIFLLAQAITIPIYGKLGDLYGRRKLLLIAISIFVGSSALCGFAHSMGQLVAFRGLQGIGAGGLVPLVQAVVGEIVPPRDRGKYQGLISSAYAASAVMGPAVGGLIVDNASWRWIFYVNVPVGGLALAVIGATMPRIATPSRRHAIDFTGAGLLAIGTGALLLGLIWAGDGTPQSSTKIAVAFAAAAAALFAFVRVERRTEDPILPLRLLRQRTVATGAFSTFIAAMCMFGTVAFVPLFAQRVIGISATSSGVVLTPFTFGAVTASIASGQWIARTGRYRASALCGAVVLGLAMFLLWRMNVTTTTFEAARNMVLGGLGMGLLMNVFVVSSQNAVPRRIIGTTTALLQFARAVGTSVGVTLFGVIIAQGLPPAIARHRTEAHRLSPAHRLELANALHPAFLMATISCAVMFLAIFFGLEQRPLRDTVDELTPALEVER
jgi:EmrB/QacA subfamily drug resistance transporter